MARGLSVERLAHESDLSIRTLCHIAEHVSDPRLSTVLTLFRGLGVTAGELLDDLPLAVEAPATPADTRQGQELTRDS